MRFSTIILVLASVAVVSAVSLEVGQLYPFLALGLVFVALASGRYLAENSHILLARLGFHPRRADRRYLRALFGVYAPEFDEHLLVELRYVAPNLLMQIVMQNHEGKFDHVLDVGCGTGLCGPLFEPFCGRMTGIDLSPDMLAKAEQKGCYDLLIEADLNLYLEANPASADLILAADVLVYAGTLTRSMQAISMALVPGGMAAFTLEDLDAPSGESGWTLNASGRYAHSINYVRETALRAGLDVLDFQRATLRTQGDASVAGQVWLFVKPHADDLVS